MLNKRFRMTLSAALTVAALLLAACGVTPGGQVPPTSTVVPTEAPTGAPSPTPGSDPHGVEPTPGAIITGTAQIDTVELLILESFPVQVNAHVVGWLGDGCTTMGAITQERDGNTFTVVIPTERPADAICTQQLVGFEETIPLDVHGLPAGTYTVDVNGVTETFTLDVDNVLES
jgi:inhibitor of cysteine peptidase